MVKKIKLYDGSMQLNRVSHGELCTKALTFYNGSASCCLSFRLMPLLPCPPQTVRGTHGLLGVASDEGEELLDERDVSRSVGGLRVNQVTQ